MDMTKFLQAVRVLLNYKQEILAVAKSTSEQVEMIYTLILSVLTAYEAIKNGNVTRSLNGDAAAIVAAYHTTETSEK